MSEWISVKDRLPEECSSCLVSVIYGINGRLQRKTEIAFFDFGYTWLVDGGIITHWQPLPQPPEDKEKEGL